MMAQASNLKEAISVLEDGMKGTMADYTIASVSETQIMDIYPFERKVRQKMDNYDYIPDWAIIEE